MRLTLATLPLHAVDLDGRLTLRHGSDDAPGTRVAVLGLDADALLAAAPHLGAELTLTLCDGAPAPGPSRDELAARLAEAERELAYVTRQRDAADSAHTALSRWAQRVVSDIGALAAGKPLGPRAPEYGHSLADDLRTLAARVDPQPTHGAAGLGAGVSADVVDGWRERLSEASLYGAGMVDVSALLRGMRDAAALARQDVRSADRGAEAVEPRERVGSAVERVVIAEGVAAADTIGSALIDGVPTYEMAADIRRVVRQHEGQRVRLVVEVLAEGSDVHTDSVALSSTTGEGP